MLLRAEEPLEEGEQELDPDLRAPIEPPPTEDEFRVALGFCSLLGQCGIEKRLRISDTNPFLQVTKKVSDGLEFR